MDNWTNKSEFRCFVLFFQKAPNDARIEWRLGEVPNDLEPFHYLVVPPSCVLLSPFQAIIPPRLSPHFAVNAVFHEGTKESRWDVDLSYYLFQDWNFLQHKN